MRALDEIDRAARQGLVHRHVGRAVARQPLARSKRLCERVAERRHDVLGRVVLVDLQIAAREHLEADGQDAHHVAEAAFKALGRALRVAIAPGASGSTKGAM